MAEARELLDLIKSRRSVREFEPDMIPQEVLDHRGRNLCGNRKERPVADYRGGNRQGRAG